MIELARRRELAMLSRLLDVPPGELAGLDLDAGGLQIIRESLSATLFDASRPALRRVASASKLLPDRSVAKIGEQVFGPLLCARTVGLLSPKHALGVALRMPEGFLADTSAQLDPREAHALIAALPTEHVVAVARELAARADHLTLARFVEHLSKPVIEAVIASIPDEIALFRIATFVESSTRVSELLGLLPPARLRRLVTALGDSELWLEALQLVAGLERTWLRTLGDLAAELDTGVLDGMVRSVREHGAWELALQLVVEMSEASQRTFFDLPSVDDDVIRHLIAAADRRRNGQPMSAGG